MNFSEQKNYFTAHIRDLIEQCRKSGVPKFTNFLTTHEQLEARKALMGEDFLVFGGIPDSERNIIGVFSESYAVHEEDKTLYFPIEAVTFTFRNQDKLSHRDFLGCILGFRLKREMIGDIYVSEGYAVVFALESITDILLQIEKVGSVGVFASKGIIKEIPQRKYQKIDTIVSSLRLDCIVSSITNLSREKSSQLIKSGSVFINDVFIKEISSLIKLNDVISVRGFGKFKLSELGGETRNNRRHIVLLKYI